MNGVKCKFEYGYDDTSQCFMHEYLLKAIDKALSRISYK